MAPDLAALYARAPLGMRLGLDAMHASCTRLGHPERAFDVVHVAGTNGKGSTSAMVEAMVRAGGKKTGLYTSPHLCKFAERIRIDGEPISDDALASVLARALEERDLSFFEAATLAALLAFRDAGVELAVIEVGIGGRLDATNVIPPPRASAITRVAFDHQDRLGDTLDAIAREKAGIAKRGAPLVLGELGHEARKAVLEVARDAGARVLDALVLPEDVTVALGGAHQRGNAAVAWTIGEVLGLEVAARREGLSRVRWPGRLERIETSDGPFLLDGAHNPDGAEALVAALASSGAGAIVFGALADKAWPEMLDVLARVSAPRFYVAPHGRAPAQPAALAARVEGEAHESLESALAAARRVAGRGLVVVCGSLYLVGEARARLLGLPQDPPVAL
ncbi:MAG: folylpolyglutamate synthase/dihydrofolate synthase family protein [Rubrivivax sp.]